MRVCVLKVINDFFLIYTNRNNVLFVDAPCRILRITIFVFQNYFNKSRLDFISTANIAKLYVAMKRIYYNSIIYTCLNNLLFLYGMNITKAFFLNALNQDENDKENKK